MALNTLGRFEEARTEIKLAQKGWESRGRPLAVALCLEQLAALAFNQGAIAEGVVEMERRLTIAEQVLGADSPSLVPILAPLGRYYLVNGQLDLAKSSLARIETLLGPNPWERSPGFLAALQLKAQISADAGDTDQAERLFKQAIAISDKYENARAGLTGYALLNLAGVLYSKAERYKEAVEAYAKAIDIPEDGQNGDHSPIVGYALVFASRALRR